MAVALLGRMVPRIRPRKLRLSPFQRELLWMLEEVGAESVPTIFATLRLVPLSAGEDLSGVFVHDTRLLWIAGLVEVCRSYHAPVCIVFDYRPMSIRPSSRRSIGMPAATAAAGATTASA